MRVNILNLFKRKESIQNYFPRSEFQSLDVKASIYPLFVSFEKRGFFAYSTRFMVKPEELLVVEHVIESFFNGRLTMEKKTFVECDKK